MHSTEAHGITLGRLLATPAALSSIAYAGYRPDDLIVRHVRGDRGVAPWHGDIDDLGIASAYRIDGQVVWVVTQPSPRRTTLLLDDELRT